MATRGRVGAQGLDGLAQRLGIVPLDDQDDGLALGDVGGSIADHAAGNGLQQIIVQSHRKVQGQGYVAIAGLDVPALHGVADGAGQAVGAEIVFGKAGPYHGQVAQGQQLSFRPDGAATEGDRLAGGAQHGGPHRLRRAPDVERL